MRKLLLIVICTLALALVAGCGTEAEKSSGAVLDSAKEAAEEAKQATEDAVDDAAETAGDAYDAAKEGAEDLADQASDKVDDWKKALSEKEAELAKLKKEVDGLSAQDLMSGKGKDLKSRYEKLKEEVKKLREKAGV